MNEREVKSGKTKICSVSGRECLCEAGTGCSRRRRGSPVDKPPSKALRWARTSELRLAEAIADLDLALEGLEFERAYPAPEWREARRLIAAALTYLRESNE